MGIIAVLLFLQGKLGETFYVSTTHMITGALVGVGAARRMSAVRWGIAGNILIAWVITLPAAARVSALCYLLSGLLM